ncbi:MAG: hypothetical protein WAK91_19450, partial [Candidatus Acidiferrales bacterium]
CRLGASLNDFYPAAVFTGNVLGIVQVDFLLRDTRGGICSSVSVAKVLLRMGFQARPSHLLAASL